MQCSAVVGGRGLQSIELTPTLAIIAANSQYWDTETLRHWWWKWCRLLHPHPSPPPPRVRGGLLSAGVQTPCGGDMRPSYQTSRYSRGMVMTVTTDRGNKQELDRYMIFVHISYLATVCWLGLWVLLSSCSVSWWTNVFNNICSFNQSIKTIKLGFTIFSKIFILPTNKLFLQFYWLKLLLGNLFPNP